MDEHHEQKLRELTAKADSLNMQQQKLASEISQLRSELQQFTAETKGRTVQEKAPEVKTTPLQIPPVQKVDPVLTSTTPPPRPPMPPPIPTRGQPWKKTHSTAPGQKTPLEDFIGTNLLNKIGIAVLVIGLGIGAKYAIDHELINPLTRIVLGYVAGIVLIVLSMRLKEKYKAFSAVLLSGGIAVLYFMTFLAYNPFELIPQTVAFALMVLFTGFTVFAALQYDMRVIALIGLVGAYAVPFLLSDGSGRVHVLFIYMTIINAGILFLSFKKHWKILYYVAFGLTWLIYLTWFAGAYEADTHLAIALIFSTFFFATFYTMFIAYKVIRKEPLSVPDVILLLINAFMYYGFGYGAISDAENGELYLGLFTVFNAFLHFLACFLIYKRQDASRDIFYLLAGMVLVFLTLAVPVQFDGHWVTLIWAFESALLFWIGRTKNFPIYEKISYAMIVLTFLGLFYDWNVGILDYELSGEMPIVRRPFLNMQLLSSLLVAISWGVILLIKSKNAATTEKKNLLISIFDWVVPILMILVLYVAFYQEIAAYWDVKYYASAIELDEYAVQHNADLLYFGSLSLIIYSSIFVAALWLVNIKWTKNTYLYYAISQISAFIVLVFITGGLYALTELRDAFLHGPSLVEEDPYQHGIANVAIRYISMIIVLPLLWIMHRTAKTVNLSDTLKNVQKVFIIFIGIVVSSSELLNILDLAHVDNSDRLALSVLWGVCALLLIIYGLKRDDKILRIIAIVIFGVTLVKLFLYDIAELSTIAKTIVMVILGALLLIASFIYNKFKKAKDEA